MTHLILCQDPRAGEDFTDEREEGLQRNRWLDRYVGHKNWTVEYSWSIKHHSWTNHYTLNCSASLAALFKLTWGGM